jgi:hypothetical protein
LVAGIEAQLPDICSAWVAYCPAEHVCWAVTTLTIRRKRSLMGEGSNGLSCGGLEWRREIKGL